MVQDNPSVKLSHLFTSFSTGRGSFVMASLIYGQVSKREARDVYIAMIVVVQGVRNKYCREIVLPDILSLSLHSVILVTITNFE